MSRQRSGKDFWIAFFARLSPTANDLLFQFSNTLDCGYEKASQVVERDIFYLGSRMILLAQSLPEGRRSTPRSLLSSL